jgi:hypothetical protein
LQANRDLVPTAENYAEATGEFSAKTVSTVSERLRYEALLQKYNRGDRAPALLREVALFAIHQNDQAHATASGNDYLDLAPQPYTTDTWRFIAAVTRTSRDRGFRLMLKETKKADSFLGENTAEMRVREIISREEIAEALSSKSAEPDWDSLQKTIAKRYGNLGTEELYGQEMLYFLRRQDWTRFGEYCALYFDTASSRSEYPIGSLSYELLTHVSDKRVLEVAIKANQYDLDTEKTHDPARYDSYANLLYKVARNREAIEFEKRALSLSFDQNSEFAQHLMKMEAGEPTWPSPTDPRGGPRRLLKAHDD